MGSGAHVHMARPSKGFCRELPVSGLQPFNRRGYLFLSDQDDIWKPAKIDRAARWLASIPDDVPALYCSRTQLIDEHGNSLGYSPLFKRQPCFANALAQNVGGGNTMAFNRAARDLLVKPVHTLRSSPTIGGPTCWSACGGHVHYDGCPSILYRQHGGNLIGANKSARARLYRLNMLLKGHLKAWNDTHIEALMPHQSMMSPENRAKLNCFSQARNRSFFHAYGEFWDQASTARP